MEDAKVLDKYVLLSDISIHREQMNEKCRLFPVNDVYALGKMILEEEKKEHISNINEGLLEMRNNALEYSKVFERLLWEDRNL